MINKRIEAHIREVYEERDRSTLSRRGVSRSVTWTRPEEEKKEETVVTRRRSHLVHSECSSNSTMKFIYVCFAFLMFSAATEAAAVGKSAAGSSARGVKGSVEL